MRLGNDMARARDCCHPQVLGPQRCSTAFPCLVAKQLPDILLDCTLPSGSPWLSVKIAFYRMEEERKWDLLLQQGNSWRTVKRKASGWSDIHLCAGGCIEAWTLTCSGGCGPQLSSCLHLVTPGAPSSITGHCVIYPFLLPPPPPTKGASLLISQFVQILKAI